MRFPVATLAAAAIAAADSTPAVHGFVSFGAVSTPGVNWVGETRGVDTDFYEAALNAVSTPLPDLRLGAQVFTRNFLGEDAGRVSLDWANADWRPDNRFGLAIGRVKLPLGLYNESLDVDAARTPVFLPRSIYALNSRDLFISTDGAKAYGLLDGASLGSLEYAAVAGRSHLTTDGGFATYLSKTGLGTPIRDIEAKGSMVAMAHWHTPVHGLGFRLTYAQLRGLHVNGDEAGGTSLDTDVGIYSYLIASLAWECGRLTLASEYQRTHGRFDFTTLLSGLVVGSSSNKDNNEGGYISATWSATRQLDLYSSFNYQRSDVAASGATTTFWVAAARYDLTDHWLIKGEFQEVRGQNSLTAGDNPDGLPSAWQIFALKTTVDF